MAHLLMAHRNHYRFRSEWLLPTDPARVYDVLEDIGGYAIWWPEIRAVRRLSDDAAEITCRATLPYELVFTTTSARQDRDAGVLEATMRGDLDGTSRWTIRPTGDGTTVAVFEEEVEAMKPLLRALAPMARPVFRWNHELMMRHGQEGLTRHVQG